MTIAIGFDTGGTFTDFAMVDSTRNRWYFTKVRTTPNDRSLASVEGVQSLLGQAACSPHEVSYVGHGSTVVTNIMIERSGAKTALVTTAGFRDVLEIRRQVMPHRYDVRVPKPVPFVPRLLRREVQERVLYDGTIERPLDENELRALLDELREEGIESIAVSFLHAYVNPTNEQRARAIIRDHSDCYICASHEVLNEFREYERTSTTVANAYVAPSMQKYLDRLEQRFQDEIGVETPILVFQSNGGVVPASQARDLPITCVVSGPAAGVVACSAVARQIGVRDFISLDMGGTSCDVSLVKDGVPMLAYGQDIAGWAVRAPRLDIHTVGAGGGSIAWLDRGGLLRVGPQSAGADPGPACYDGGGIEPTVTDANAILGRLNPHYLLSGRMSLNLDKAVEAIETIGQEKGLDVAETAEGILDVVNSTMVRAIRVVTIERGYDPRSFALVAFGGAGPLHACDLAQEMGIATIIVPPYPGVLSAVGLLLADLRLDGSASRRYHLGQVTPELLHDTFTEVEERLRASPALRSRPDANWRARYSLDIRYIGQSHELQVPVSASTMANGSTEAIASAFNQEHQRRYGFATVTAEKEIVGFRVTLEAPSSTPAGAMPAFDLQEPVAPDRRPVYFKKLGWVDDCPVYQRASIRPGTTIEGPAIIEQMDSTLVITPGFQATVDEHTNVIMTSVER